MLDQRSRCAGCGGTGALLHGKKRCPRVPSARSVRGIHGACGANDCDSGWQVSNGVCVQKLSVESNSYFKCCNLGFFVLCGSIFDRSLEYQEVILFFSSGLKTPGADAEMNYFGA